MILELIPVLHQPTAELLLIWSNCLCLCGVIKFMGLTISKAFITIKIFNQDL